jgi:mannitol-1-phosphate/altronate dehydrogenase
MSGAAAKIFDPLLRVARARSRRIPVFLSVILSERSESKDPYNCKNHSVAAWDRNKVGIVDGQRGPSTPRYARCSG